MAGDSFNIDFGNSDIFPGITPPPASSFGASANQPGVWNQLTSVSPLALVELSGAPTAVQIQSSAQVFGGFYSSFSGDLGRLLNDNFFSNPGVPWSISISGLANGEYDFYYYAPAHPFVDSGNFAINGTIVPNLAGSDAGSGTVRGLDWQVLTGVAVTDGTLTTTWIEGGGQFTGLSGIQIVSVVPEPSSLALAISSILVVSYGRRLACGYRQT